MNLRTSTDEDAVEEPEGQLPCHAKLAFRTREQAQAAAAQNAYYYTGKLKTYLCRYCGSWHLSSRT